MMHKRLAMLLTSFFISASMACIMSFAMLYIHVGYSDQFIAMWMSNWGVGLCVGFPSALVIVPLTRRLVSKITRVEL